MYASHFFASKKGSGKTTVIQHLLRKFINSNFKLVTQVHWLSETHEDDLTMQKFKRDMDKVGYDFTYHSDYDKSYFNKEILEKIAKHNEEIKNFKKIEKKKQTLL